MFSAFLSYTLLMVDLGLIVWLGLHAYRDADTLDRFVTFLGALGGGVEADMGTDARYRFLDRWRARFWMMSEE